MLAGGRNLVDEALLITWKGGARGRYMREGRILVDTWRERRFGGAHPIARKGSRPQTGEGSRENPGRFEGKCTQLERGR